MDRDVRHLISTLSWNGRVGRLEWLVMMIVAWVLFSAFLNSIGLSLDQFFKALAGGSEAKIAALFKRMINPPVDTPFWAPLLAISGGWIQIVAYIKRYHDRDKSGLWYFVSFVPVIGPFWVLIECALLSGTPGQNQYDIYDDAPARSQYSPEPRQQWSRAAQSVLTTDRATPRPAETRPTVLPAGFGRRSR